MTAKQRAARAKFKAVVAEAKKLRKKNPKLTQAQAVKQAWAISYSKQRKGSKLAEVGKVKKKSAVKATKVKARKKKSSSEMHTDTKSHNVNIRVMSGVGKHFKNYKVYKKHIIDIEKTPAGNYVYIAHGGHIHVPFVTNQLSIAKKFIDRVVSMHRIKKSK